MLKNYLIHLVFVCLLAACHKPVHQQQKFHYHKRAYSVMGSVLDIELWQIKPEAIESFEHIYQLIKTIDQNISHYQANSPLSQINQTAGSGQCISIDQDFQQLLALSLQDYQDSQHYFNPGIEPLVQALSQSQSIQPDQQQIIHHWIDFKQQVQVIKDCVYLKDQQAQLNFSASGKGFALKKVQAYLEQSLALHKAKISLGEQVLMWSKNKQEVWEHYLRNPNAPQQALAKWVTGNGSIASSAKYGKQALYVNTKQAYIVDPVNMREVRQQTMTSVYHRDPYQADVFSTLFHVLACDQKKIKAMYPKAGFSAFCLNQQAKVFKQGQAKAKVSLLPLE